MLFKNAEKIVDNGQTPELKKFIKEFGNTFVINKKQEFKFDFSQF